MRQYATQHLRMFFRAGVSYFRTYIMELLIDQLYDLEPDVGRDALDVLDEACQDEVQVQWA